MKLQKSGILNEFLECRGPWGGFGGVCSQWGISVCHQTSSSRMKVLPSSSGVTSFYRVLLSGQIELGSPEVNFCLLSRQLVLLFTACLGYSTSCQRWRRTICVLWGEREHQRPVSGPHSSLVTRAAYCQQHRADGVFSRLNKKQS